MKSQVIISVSVLMWVIALTYITFFSDNTYLNMVIFFFGLMGSICGFAYVLDKEEKQTK